MPRVSYQTQSHPTQYPQYSKGHDFRHPVQRAAAQETDSTEEEMNANPHAGELPRYANDVMISGVAPAHHAGRPLASSFRVQMDPPVENYVAPAAVPPYPGSGDQLQSSPPAPTPPGTGSPLGKQPNPKSKPPAPREDHLGDKIFNTILAGMGDVHGEDDELRLIARKNEPPPPPQPDIEPSTKTQGGSAKSRKASGSGIKLRTGLGDGKATVRTKKKGQKGAKGGVILKSKQSFQEKPWKINAEVSQDKEESFQSLELDEAWEEAMREGDTDIEIQRKETHEEGPDERPESEASVARLGPDDEEEDEEDELDGLRRHVATRAQNVDALENAAKRRKDDVATLLHQLEQTFTKHSNEEVSHARAEVLHAWMQAQLLHLKNAPETKRARAIPGVVSGSWEALRANVVVDVAHTRAAANTELAKRQECLSRLRERYSELQEARHSLGDLLEERWGQLTESLDGMCRVGDNLVAGEEKAPREEGDLEQESELQRGRLENEVWNLDKAIAQATATQAAQADLIKSVKNHYVIVMMAQQERMLQEKKLVLLERLNELEENATTSFENEAMGVRAQELEQQTNMLVQDNTVLAKALTAVEAWAGQVRPGR